MQKPYSETNFRSLLQALSAWRSVRVADLPEVQDARGYAVVRCDIERAPQRALRLAEMLADAGVWASFYALGRRDAFSLPILTSIQDMGHEVGLHYECLDRCKGDFTAARSLFRREVELFREGGLDIRTACAHSELLLMKDGYTLNGELVWEYPTLLRECGLVGDAELLARRLAMIHLSDRLTQMRYLMRVVASAPGSRGLHVLIHPHRWASTLLVVFSGIGRDVYQGISNLLRGARPYDALVPVGVPTHPTFT